MKVVSYTLAQFFDDFAPLFILGLDEEDAGPGVPEDCKVPRVPITPASWVCGYYVKYDARKPSEKFDSIHSQIEKHGDLQGDFLDKRATEPEVRNRPSVQYRLLYARQLALIRPVLGPCAQLRGRCSLPGSSGASCRAARLGRRRRSSSSA